MKPSSVSLRVVPKTKIAKKEEEIAHLDTATREIILRLNKSDSRLKISGFLSVFVVLVVGVVGILYQNHIANQNKQHIDCIVKLLATPQKPGTTHKFIDNLNTTCNIKFTK